MIDCRKSRGLGTDRRLSTGRSLGTGVREKRELHAILFEYATGIFCLAQGCQNHDTVDEVESSLPDFRHKCYAAFCALIVLWDLAFWTPPLCFGTLMMLTCMRLFMLF